MAAEEDVSSLKHFLVTYVMPEKCYEHFFHRLTLTHGPCVKILISKVVSFWIIGELIAPFFQIWRVVRVGGAQGLSSVSAYLDLLAVTAHTAYCIKQKFPIGAFGESIFLLLLLTLLMFLIHCYKGNVMTGCVVVGVHSGIMYLLTSAVTPNTVVVMMKEWSVLIIIASRLIQAWCNLNNGSTGQLSTVSVLLVFLASVGRTFTSVQEAPESLGSQASVLSSCCTLLLLLQIWIYRSQSSLRQKQKTN